MNTKIIILVLSFIFVIGVSAPVYAEGARVYAEGAPVYAEGVPVYAEEAPVQTEETPILSGRVIILDPGHDEETDNYYQGYSENERMLVLAEKIKPRLEALGATVHLTRYSEKRMSSEVRCAYINKWALEAVKGTRMYDNEDIDSLIWIMQLIIYDPEVAEIYMNTPYEPERTIHPDLVRILEYEKDSEVQNRFLFISLHSNASATLPVYSGDKGASAFYLSPDDDEDTRNYYEGFSPGEVHKDIGDMILDHITKSGFENLGTEVGNYFMIREHNIPGVLVENGHHTNVGDRAMLQSDDFMEILADAYADAVVEYFRAIPLPERFFAAEEPEEEEEADDQEATDAEDIYEIKRVLLYIR